MILILGFSAIGAAGADTMNCGRRIIAREVLSAEVLARCGAPDHRETWFDGAHAPFPPTEVWTYDRGPRQLIRRLRFVNGRLESIDTDGYGYPERLDGDCRPTDIVERLSSYRLYRECGEPMSRERVELLAPRRAPVYPPARPPVALRAVHRERWIYNFGSSYLMRAVTLEHGRVTEVQSLGRGLD